MSELVQVKKQLTFEEIAPQWSLFISQAGSARAALMDKALDTKLAEKLGFAKLKFTDVRFCIVGEAHGFSSNYCYEKEIGFCKPCHSFAYAFMCKEEVFEERKSAFVQHWNEVHVK